VEPLALGRPAYRPATLLKIYIYGYLDRVPSSRRLERECQRNIELIWLTGRLAPDFKTIADFRKDNGGAIAKVCREFVMLCRKLGLLSVASVAIDGSKFKAVNAREKNFTEAKMKRRPSRSRRPSRAFSRSWKPPTARARRFRRRGLRGSRTGSPSSKRKRSASTRSTLR
jgi:transposase